MPFFKIKKRFDPNNNGKILKNDKIFYCPACERNHKAGKRCKISGSVNKPSLSCELIFNSLSKHNMDSFVKCHLKIKDGYINYFEDCTHKFAGKSIKMMTLEESEELLNKKALNSGYLPEDTLRGKLK